MSVRSNAILARWARDALREYGRVSGWDVTEAALVPLLIASLLHLASHYELDPAAVMDEARRLYDGEEGV